jgi:hypothetical protein
MCVSACISDYAFKSLGCKNPGTSRNGLTAWLPRQHEHCAVCGDLHERFPIGRAGEDVILHILDPTVFVCGIFWVGCCHEQEVPLTIWVHVRPITFGFFLFESPFERLLPGPGVGLEDDEPVFWDRILSLESAWRMMNQCFGTVCGRCMCRVVPPYKCRGVDMCI